MTKINLREERDFGQKINSTFYFVQQNFKPLFKCLLYYAGPICLLAGIFGGLYQSDILNQVGDIQPGDNPLEILARGIYSIYYFLMILVQLVSYLMVFGVVYAYMAEYLEDCETEITPKRVWQRVNACLGSLTLASILNVLAVALGLVLCILPGIYIGVAFSLFGAAIFFENLSATDALSRSIALMKDKWWSTFGIIVVVSIIQSMMGVAFQIPLLIVNLFEAMQLWQGDGQMLLILVSVVSILGSTLLSSLLNIALGFQYFNLVERHESIGLMSEIDSLGSRGQQQNNEGQY